MCHEHRHGQYLRHQLGRSDNLRHQRLRHQNQWHRCLHRESRKRLTRDGRIQLSQNLQHQNLYRLDQFQAANSLRRLSEEYHLIR